MINSCDRPTELRSADDRVSRVAGQVAPGPEPEAIACPLHPRLEVVHLAVEDVRGADDGLTVGRLTEELLRILTRHCNTKQHNATAILPTHNAKCSAIFIFTDNTTKYASASKSMAMDPLRMLAATSLFLAKCPESRVIARPFTRL